MSSGEQGYWLQVVNPYAVSGALKNGEKAREPDGWGFGILERTLPDYQVPITLTVDAITPDGVRKQLFSMKHSGGLITIPYLEEEHTLLKVSVSDKERNYLRYQGGKRRVVSVRRIIFKMIYML